jgi:hypothetical protein
MFSIEDHRDLENRGISISVIEDQLLRFSKGFPFLSIARPAIPGDGILVPREETLKDFVTLYESNSSSEKVLKFVPASGAATRMFKDLYAYNEADRSEYDDRVIDKFISGLPRFAFYDELKACLTSKGQDLESLVNSGEYRPVIKCLMDPECLNYGNRPKGLLPFHRYVRGSRTAFEEHLVEGALYCKGNNGIARIHLTVSPEHKQAFERKLREVKKDFEDKYGSGLLVEFSTQDPSTDTIAVDADNKPVRDDSGRMVFRPGGHGALLGNVAFIQGKDFLLP